MEVVDPREPRLESCPLTGSERTPYPDFNDVIRHVTGFLSSNHLETIVISAPSMNFNLQATIVEAVEQGITKKPAKKMHVFEKNDVEYHTRHRCKFCSKSVFGTPGIVNICKVCDELSHDTCNELAGDECCVCENKHVTFDAWSVDAVKGTSFVSITKPVEFDSLH